MTPEEEEQLMLLTALGPPEKLQESSPLDAARGARVVEYMDDQYLGKDPVYRVPDAPNAPGVGTREEAATYLAALAQQQQEAQQRRQEAEKQAAFERALDEYVRKQQGQTGTPGFGGAPPPWRPKK